MFKSRLLQGDEKVIAFFRRHELALLPTILEVFVLIFIPWHIVIRSRMFLSDNTATIVLLVWSLLVLLYGGRKVWLWLKNAYYVTDQRLILVRQDGVFKRSVTETPLVRISNVSFSTNGFLSTLLRYGDVTVQLAGAENNLILKGVANASRVRDFIWEYASHSKTI
jgi:membrane protein YdbS with pleckstrin-like domain